MTKKNKDHQIKPRTKRKMKWRRIVSITIVLLLIPVLVYASSVGYNVYTFMNKIQSITGQSAQQVDNIKTEPFTVLLIGAGTNGQDEQAGADAIHLLSINPQQKYAELISIPRDSYVPRAQSCDYPAYFDKITNSGADLTCLQNTVEALFDITINYYVTINFNSFVQIIDALGEIEMNVPDLREGFEQHVGSWDNDTYLDPKLKTGTQWCDHDSQRNPYAVCFTQFGVQTVNGEQALALARSRYYDSDFARGLRQAEMIQSMIKKILSPTSIGSIDKLLQVSAGNLQTNIPTHQFLDFAKLGQQLFDKKTAAFKIRTTQLDGESSTFAGDLETASYNKVSIQSIEDIRKKLAILLFQQTATALNVNSFHYEPEIGEYASKYGAPFLEDTLDISDATIIKKFH